MGAGAAHLAGYVPAVGARPVNAEKHPNPRTIFKQTIRQGREFRPFLYTYFVACFGGFFEPYGIRRPQKHISNYYTPSERECLPYPDFGNGRHFCKEKARTQWRSSRQCALSRMDRLCAKDGATSDAESFAVTGTVSHIRQMPRIKRPGWRSAFFLFPTRLSFDISGACSTLGNTKIQGTEFMIQRNQKS